MSSFSLVPWVLASPALLDILEGSTHILRKQTRCSEPVNCSAVCRVLRPGSVVWPHRGPVAGPCGVCRQDADHRAGVVQLTGHHGLVGLIKVDPADRHVVLLALASDSLAVPDAGEVSGKEYAQRFRDAAGRWHVLIDYFGSPGGISEALRVLLA